MWTFGVSKTQDESCESMPTTSKTPNSEDNYTKMHELEAPNFPAELEPTEPSGNVLLAADASPAVKVDKDAKSLASMASEEEVTKPDTKPKASRKLPSSFNLKVELKKPPEVAQSQSSVDKCAQPTDTADATATAESCPTKASVVMPKHNVKVESNVKSSEFKPKPVAAPPLVQEKTSKEERRPAEIDKILDQMKEAVKIKKEVKHETETVGVKSEKRI